MVSEWLQLQTSNLVCASTARNSFDRSKGTWPIFSDLDFKFVDLCDWLKLQGVN